MDQHDDDKPVGRVLNRREFIKLMGGASVALLASASLGGVALSQRTRTPTPAPTPSSTALPSCIVRPEQAEGPYFVDNMLDRMDIRSDPETEIVKEGALFKLAFVVSDVSNGTCTPIEGAQVDIWHCDANGVYSGVLDPRSDTRGEYWLRGFQRTDENGHAEFITIYPGWYPGRAVHIHFKIRTDPDEARGYEFTSQLYFDDEFTDQVFLAEPYAIRGERSPRNEGDGLFVRQNGEDLMLEVTENEDEEEGGYVATFSIGLDLSGASA